MKKRWIALWVFVWFVSNVASCSYSNEVRDAYSESKEYAKSWLFYKLYGDDI